MSRWLHKFHNLIFSIIDTKSSFLFIKCNIWIKAFCIFANMKGTLYLLIAIAFEIVATTYLKKSEEFTKLVPSIITVVGYGVAFYCLSLSLRTIPVGIAYAIWSGVGIVLITLVGILVFKQTPDLPAIIGLLFIIIGVAIINIFSKMNAH